MLYLDAMELTTSSTTWQKMVVQSLQHSTPYRVLMELAASTATLQFKVEQFLQILTAN